MFSPVGAALSHFQDTGKLYPLCVKLGTITQHGADVWSYADDEDMPVIDPNLADHLSHWGIDIMKLEKTVRFLCVFILIGAYLDVIR